MRVTRSYLFQNSTSWFQLKYRNTVMILIAIRVYVQYVRVSWSLDNLRIPATWCVGVVPVCVNIVDSSLDCNNRLTNEQTSVYAMLCVCARVIDCTFCEEQLPLITLSGTSSIRSSPSSFWWCCWSSGTNRFLPRMDAGVHHYFKAWRKNKKTA